ncbi:MAG: hypothetical protein E4H06_01680 [Methanosarcina sp.]|nr:MAG: hypothetical protein E4H06_01680 [Methanosarcina sp.]
MKKIFALVLFITIGILVLAQQNYQDVVYLKNGSIIRGTIIEHVPNKSIKIETADRSVMVYQIEDIEKMTKEAIQSKDNSSKKYSYKKSGYLGIVELGYAFGIKKAYDFLNFNVINGYKFNHYFSLGFGTGLKYYFESSALAIPLFADFRGYLLDGNITPYIELGIGYSFLVHPDAGRLGFLLNPSVGGSFKVGNKTALNLSVGYLLHIVNKTKVGAININFGFSF